MSDPWIWISLIILAISNIASWIILAWLAYRHSYEYQDLWKFVRSHNNELHMIKNYLSEVRVVCLESKNVTEEEKNE